MQVNRFLPLTGSEPSSQARLSGTRQPAQFRANTDPSATPGFGSSGDLMSQLLTSIEYLLSTFSQLFGQFEQPQFPEPQVEPQPETGETTPSGPLPEETEAPDTESVEESVEPTESQDQVPPETEENPAEPQPETEAVEVSYIEYGAREDNLAHAGGVVHVARQHGAGGNDILNVPPASHLVDDFYALAGDEAVNAEGVNAYIEDSATYLLDQVSTGLEDFMAQNPEGGPHVLNGSLANNKVLIYQDIELLVNENPAAAEAILGDAAGGSEAERRQAIVDYVDETLANSDRFNESLNNYRETTAQAADNGIYFVVAAGNHQREADAFAQSGVQLDDGAAYNFLAMSDDVISVAASDDNGSAQLDDDTVADFSSSGNGEFNPTVAATGVDVMIPGQGPKSGTSYAAPEVSAAIAHHLGENPDASFEDVEQFLRDNAVDTAAGEAEEGAGVFDANQARERQVA